MITREVIEIPDCLTLFKDNIGDTKYISSLCLMMRNNFTMAQDNGRHLGICSYIFVKYYALSTSKANDIHVKLYKCVNQIEFVPKYLLCVKGVDQIKCLKTEYIVIQSYIYILASYM